MEATIPHNGRKTYFAPPERLARHEVLAQNQSFLSIPVLAQILDSLPVMVMVLNHQRQIIFGNRPLAEKIGADAGLLGMRPGEALSCIHSADMEAGCGTGPHCPACGAVLAIMEAVSGGRAEQECRLTLRGGDDLESLDLLVSATPMETAAGPLILVAASDISNQKRRQVLERVFFHDILNTAGSISGLAKLLHEEQQERGGAAADLIFGAADALIDEITGFRELLAAESAALRVHPEVVDIPALASRAAGQLLARPELGGRNVDLSGCVSCNNLVSDPVLVRRVLTNLIKNALESSAPGETVIVASDSLEHGGCLISVQNRSVMEHMVQLQVFKRSFSTKGPGRGLGTYSVKLLTEGFLGGKAWFESNREAGTIFYVRLPDAAPDLPPAEPL